MTDASSGSSEMIRRARQGDRTALGRLMEHYRPWLRILARRELGEGVAARIDDSDLVQRTMLSAVRSFEEFRGSRERELLAWLKRIHERSIQDTIRDHVLAQKRSVKREQFAEEGRIEDLIGADSRQLSPSRRTLLDEDAVRLARALETLPEDQREAVRLRHLEGLSLGELTKHFGRSREAVAGLLQRGLRKLRKQLRD